MPPKPRSSRGLFPRRRIGPFLCHGAPKSVHRPPPSPWEKKDPGQGSSRAAPAPCHVPSAIQNPDPTSPPAASLPGLADPDEPHATKLTFGTLCSVCNSTALAGVSTFEREGRERPLGQWEPPLRSLSLNVRKGGADKERGTAAQALNQWEAPARFPGVRTFGGKGSRGERGRPRAFSTNGSFLEGRERAEVLTHTRISQ